MSLRQSKTTSEPLIKMVFTSHYLGVTTESTLADHGLDSLDAIEIAMQL
jgi:acyl carrier protein